MNNFAKDASCYRCHHSWSAFICKHHCRLLILLLLLLNEYQQNSIDYGAAGVDSEEL